MATSHRDPPDRVLLWEKPAAGPVRPSRDDRLQETAATPASGALLRQQPSGRARRSPIAVLGLVVLGAAVAWQAAVAGARLPAATGETQLIDGAVAVLRQPGTAPLGSGFAELVARLQLAGYAGLTGAFDRHPELLGGARELAVVATVVVLGSIATVALRAGARPVAVAVVLAVTAVCAPAIAALATFGPGLLGAAWLSLAAALLLEARPARRVLGVLAGVVGIATAPVLAVPVAVAAVVLTARRWAPTAEVAAALGSSILVLALLSPMAATSAVVGSDRLGLAVAGAVVVVGGFLLAGLRTLAATTASALLLVALPWPGADTAVPALVVAVALTAIALVHEAAVRLATRPLPVRRALAVAMVAGWVALAVAVLPDLRPFPTADPPHTALAGWLAEATDPLATVTVPTDVRADLVDDGVAPSRLLPGGDLVVTVGRPGEGDTLARFGDGPEALWVATAVDPSTASVPDEAVARATAGTQLADNPNLDAPEGVRVVLRAGGVDSRTLVLLAGLAGRGPVTVTDLPVAAGEDVALLRHRLSITAVDGPTSTWLRAQQPPFAPTVATTAGTTTLTWPLPAPPALLG